jgi:phage FluMu protein Com
MMERVYCRHCGKFLGYAENLRDFARLHKHHHWEVKFRYG